MIDSPLVQEIVAEKNRATAQKALMAVLESRFGEVPVDVAEQIRSVTDEDLLIAFAGKAASCPDTEGFRKELRES